MDSIARPKGLSRLQTTLSARIRSARDNFLTINRHNLHTIRSQPLRELSGSFGDIGTLLPLLIALTTTHSISLPSTLVFSGLANILTGLVFGIPLPVQPMKAIAAVAIAEQFDTNVTVSAGLFVAGAVGILCVTGTMGWVTRRVPVPIIKGIQVGTGISLAMSAGKIYAPNPANNVVLVLAFVGLLVSAGFRRVPYALLVLLVGVLCVVYQQAESRFPPSEHWPRLGLWKPIIVVPGTKAFTKGMLEAGIGQLPLTALNSVIAVTFLAEDLLPEVPTPSATAIGLSVAGINLVGCWFGAMPVCHGSGGLAAQYRFGARSGASIIFLGLLKLLLGLFAQRVALWAFLGFPGVLLAVLVLAAALELAKVGESLNTRQAKDVVKAAGMDGDADDEAFTEEERMRRWMIMLTTVAGIVAFHNTAVGFLAGIICYCAYRLTDMWAERRRRGQIRLEDS